MNKKGMSPELLVGIIALMVFLVVALVIVYPPIKNWMFGAGETGACQFSVMLSSMSKKMSFGFGEIPAECKMKRITVTDKEIDAYNSLAKKRIASYKEQNNPAQYNFTDTPESEYTWALEKIVGDEMVDCLNKGWRGKLDLAATGWPTDLYNQLLSPGSYMCILCTRIKFDQTAQDLFGQKIFKMKPWLDANVKESKTYYTLLTQNVNPFYQTFVSKSWFDIRSPTAIIFIAGVSKESGELGTTGEGGVGIFNYETLTEDLGYTYTVGIPGVITTTGKSRCTIIVGD